MTKRLSLTIVLYLSFQYFLKYERLVYDKLINFLNKYNIQSVSQCGFKQNLSTILALLDLVDKLTTSIKNNEITIGIFIDLAKAFDTDNRSSRFLGHPLGASGAIYALYLKFLTQKKSYSKVLSKECQFSSKNSKLAFLSDPFLEGLEVTYAIHL